jgi:hypothetical protein
MGLYMFINEQDRSRLRKVSDPSLNEEFQEALKYHPLLMIEEYPVRRKRTFWSKWFKRPEPEMHYQLYHETPSWDGSPYQARYQISASGKKKTVIAYLHGIINGAVYQIESIKPKRDE